MKFYSWILVSLPFLPSSLGESPNSIAVSSVPTTLYPLPSSIKPRQEDVDKAKQIMSIVQEIETAVEPVAGLVSKASVPSPTPSSGMTCHGVDNNKWLARPTLADTIGEFCNNFTQQGAPDPNSNSTSRSYPGVDISIEWLPGSPFPGSANCNRYLSSLMADCDAHNPNNPMNWKHGGIWDLGTAKYRVDPNKSQYFAGVCSFHLYEHTTWFGSNIAGQHETHDYTVEIISAKDSKGIILVNDTGTQPASDINGPTGPYRLEGVYYDALVLTPESQGEYIQFNLGSQAWTSDDKNGNQRCNLGDWHKNPSTQKSKGAPLVHKKGRDLDCFMQC